MAPSDGSDMPSAFDLIGHNPALQEHWIRRFIAFLFDAVVVIVVGLFFAIPLSFLTWAWWFILLFWGTIWFVYSVLLETIFAGTIGKKILALRVVAIDRNLDIVHAVVRNLPKIFPLLVLIDGPVGAATKGDRGPRLFDRIARTTVTRVDQGAYMEEQFRMMQHAGPHPMTMPPAPVPHAPPPAPPGMQAAAAPGGWPGQAPTPSGGWPQHSWDEQGRLVKEMKFCTACGGQLVGQVGVPAACRMIRGRDVRQRGAQGHQRDPDKPGTHPDHGREVDCTLDEELGSHHGPEDAEDQPTESRSDLDLPAEDPTRELESDRHVLDPLLDLVRGPGPLGDGEVQDVRDEQGDQRDALVLSQVAV